MIVVLDFETDGLDAEKDQILEIGAEIVDGPRDGETFSGYLVSANKPTTNLPAAQVHGIPIGTVVAGEPDAVSILEFLNWLRPFEVDSITIAGITPLFDRAILLRLLREAGVELGRFVRHNTIDLHSIAMAYYKRSEGKEECLDHYLSSDDVFSWIGMDPEPKPHVAINGARWEAVALRHIFCGCGRLPIHDYEYPPVQSR